MYCESLHNKIKGYYMHRFPTRRLDDLIDLLIKMEKDAYIDHRKNKVRIIYLNYIGVNTDIFLYFCILDFQDSGGDPNFAI